MSDLFPAVARSHVALFDFVAEDNPRDPALLEAMDAAKSAFHAYEDFREALEALGAHLESLTEAHEDAPMDDPAIDDVEEWIGIFQDMSDTWALAKEIGS